MPVTVLAPPSVLARDRARAAARRGSRRLVPWALGAGAATVAAVRSGVPSIWYDEAATLQGSGRPLPALWLLMHHVDAVHGAYYALAHVLLAVTGQSLLVLRLASALAVGVATAGVWTLARRLVPGGPGSLHRDRAAVAAAVVFAVLPRTTWAGAEARDLALTAALAVWSSVLLVSLLDGARARWWVAYATLQAVAVTVDLYLALLLAAHGVTVLVLARRGRRTLPAGGAPADGVPAHGATAGAGAPPGAVTRWLAAAACAVAASWPVTRMTLAQRAQLPSGAGGAQHLFQDALVQPWFTGSLPTQDREMTWPWPPHPTWAVAVVALAILGWCALLVAAGLEARDLRAGRPGAGVVLALLVPWVVVPTAALAVLAAYDGLVLEPRYLTFTTPAAAVLLGRLAGRARRLGTVAVALLLVAALAAPVWWSQRQPTSKNGSDLRATARELATLPAGTAVLYTAYSAAVAPPFPAQTGDLVDVLSRHDAVRAGRLFDSYRSLLRDPRPDLPAACARPAACRVVILVTASSSPANRAEATSVRAALRSMGYRERWTWSGPSDDVQRWDLRSGG